MGAATAFGTPKSGTFATTNTVTTLPTIDVVPEVVGTTDPNKIQILTVWGVATSIADIPAPSTGSWQVWQANITISTNMKAVQYYRYVNSEPSTYAITGLTAGRYGWIMSAYQGVDATTPKDVTPTTASSTSGMATPPAITPVNAGALIVAVNLAIITAGVASAAWTSSNMTHDIDGGTSNATLSNASGGLAHQAWTSGAFTPNLTQTASATRGAAITSAIRGATSFARSGSESAGATDSVAYSLTQARSASESAPATGVVVRSAMAYARAGSESAPATGVPVTTLAQARAVGGETAGATDVTVGALGRVRGVSESAPATDVTARSPMAYLRSLGESAAAVDVVARAGARPRTGAESAPAGDTVTTANGKARPGAESAPATDTVAPSNARARSLHNDALATDVTAPAVGFARSLGDSAPATDVVAQTLAQARSISENPFAFADPFNRPDGPLGPDWVSLTGGPPNIVSNQVVGGSVASMSRWAIPTSTDDQISQIIYLGGSFVGAVVASPATVAGTGMAAAGTWYVLRQGTVGASNLQLMQKDLGLASFTNLGSHTVTLVAGDVIGLTYIAGVLRCYVNGGLVLTVTPATPIRGQRYVGHANGSSVQAGVPILDGWSGGDVVATTSDGTSPAFTKGRGMSESAPATDVTTRSSAKARPLSESAPAVDAQARTRSSTRSLPNSAPAVDTTVGSKGQGRSTSEQLGPVSQTASYPGFQPGQWRLGLSRPASAEVVGTATPISPDGVTRSLSTLRPTSESAPAVDTTAKSAQAYARTGPESAPAVDAAARTSARSRSQTEAAPATDVISRLVAALRGLFDSAPAVDSASNTAQSYSRAGTESAPATDTVGASSTNTRSRNLFEAASATDTTALSGTRSRSGTETAPAVDTSVGTTARTRAAAETAPATDATARSLAEPRGLPETAPANDTTAGKTATSRTAEEAAPATDTTSTLLAQVRALVETAASSDATSRFLALLRQGVEDAPAVDTLVWVIGHTYIRFLRFVERLRLILFSPRPPTVAVAFAPAPPSTTFQEDLMHLSRQGVERYQPGPSTDPAVDPAAWEASFDGKVTWVAAEVVGGEPTWLVAGPDVTGVPSGATKLPDVAWLVPALKFPNGTEVIIRDEDFEGDEQPPPIYMTG